VTGWLLAKRETAELAERLLAETIRKQNVVADQLTIHADRGTSMASKPVALLLADLGVTKEPLPAALLQCVYFGENERPFRLKPNAHFDTAELT